MISDSLKSLGYLKKSLKMSKRAIEKNMDDDDSTQSDIDEFKTGCDEMLALIDAWEKKLSPAHTVPASVGTPVTATPAIPTTPATPAPTPTAGLTVTDPNDSFVTP